METAGFALVVNLLFIGGGLYCLLSAKNIQKSAIESKRGNKLNKYNPMYWFLKSSWFVPGIRLMGLVFLAAGILFFIQICIPLLAQSRI